MKQNNISFPFGPIKDDIIKKIIQAYNAATTYVDDQIGHLLNHIDNKTIIVITGDHGNYKVGYDFFYVYLLLSAIAWNEYF